MRIFFLVAVDILQSVQQNPTQLDGERSILQDVISNSFWELIGTVVTDSW